MVSPEETTPTPHEGTVPPIPTPNVPGSSEEKNLNDLIGPQLGKIQRDRSQEHVVLDMPDEVVRAEAIAPDRVKEMRIKAELGLKELESIFSGAQNYRIDNERRIGAELEFPLVDTTTGKPSFVAPGVLNTLNGEGLKAVVAELGAHNLELNLSHKAATGSFLTQYQGEMRNLLARVNAEAERYGAKALLCGVLPSLTTDDLRLDNMFPGKPRYKGLNQTLLHEKGGNFAIKLRGQDSVDIFGSSLMAESLNTSFQLHYQVPFDQYVMYHQIADYITAPVLAVSAYSPLVAGYRGPAESRVDIWAGAISEQRVSLGGDDWMKDPLEQFRRALGFNPLLETDANGSNYDELVMWSKTVYPWNRTTPFVDTKKKVASLRIEGRPLPSGPSVVDLVANTAFFYGLMEGMAIELEGREALLSELLPYKAAQDNFRCATDNGMRADIVWLDGNSYNAQELVLLKLLPIAKAGLEKLGVEAIDAATFLGIIENRVQSGMAPADVLLKKEAQLEEDFPDRQERMNELSKWMLEKTWQEIPCHEWLL